MESFFKKIGVLFTLFLTLISACSSDSSSTNNSGVSFSEEELESAGDNDENSMVSEGNCRMNRKLLAVAACASCLAVSACVSEGNDDDDDTSGTSGDSGVVFDSYFSVENNQILLGDQVISFGDDGVFSDGVEVPNLVADVSITFEEEGPEGSFQGDITIQTNNTNEVGTLQQVSVVLSDIIISGSSTNINLDEASAVLEISYITGLGLSTLRNSRVLDHPNTITASGRELVIHMENIATLFSSEFQDWVDGREGVFEMSLEVSDTIPLDPSNLSGQVSVVDQ